MKRLVTVSIVLALAVGALAQNPQRRDVRTKTERIEVNIWDKQKQIGTNPELMYTWFFAGDIKSTQGGYDGTLLHGPYRKFDIDGNLLESGGYAKGLKDGVWKTWNDSGQLLAVGEYCNGILHGEQSTYVGGVKVASEEYKHGLLHGTKKTFENGAVVSEEDFKKGEAYVKVSLWQRIKSLFKRKPKVQPLEEVTDGQNVPVE